MTYSGLPPAATAQLEADREALGMDRGEHMVHLLYHRSLDVRAKGSGFDAPEKELETLVEIPASAAVLGRPFQPFRRVAHR